MFCMSYSLDLHAKQLQQCREDSHVVEQEDIVSGPVEDVHLGVTLIKHSWGKRMWGKAGHKIVLRSVIKYTKCLL